MYARHFGLEREPFSIAPDPRYLFMSERHREALAHLLFGVGGGGGFVLLTGEIGAGKTTVCRCFLEQVPPECDVAYIFNPKLTVQELLQTVCEEFRVEVVARSGGMPSQKDHVDALNAFLLAGHAAGRSRVLIIDEAQNLAPEVLEQLRLLTNLETHERKLLQIVLIGQPELRAMLQRPDLEQLAQRVVARYHLQALSATETLQYIEHRLTVAGLKGSLPFERKALQRIHHHARGVPRRINLLCDRALLGAYGARRERVDRAIVDQAAEEVFGAGAGARVAGPGSGSAWRRAGVALAGVGMMAGVGWLAITALQSGSAPSGPAGPDAAALPVALGVASAPPGAVSAPAGTVASGAAAQGAAAAGLAPSASPVPATPPASGALPVTAPETAAAPPAREMQDAADPAGTALAPGAAADLPAAAVAPGAGAPAETLVDWDEARDAARLFTDEAAGWRALAALWGETLQPGDACIAAARLHLRCFRAAMPLSQIASLARPGLVGLRLSDGRRRQALLVGLDERQAVLSLGATSVRLSRPVFGALWDGRFATLWRSPIGYEQTESRELRGAAALWLAGQLRTVEAGALATESAASGAGTTRAAAVATDTEDLRRRLAAFQRAWGLEADGRLGPMTFMQLNRAAQVQEPRLIATGSVR